MIAFTAEDRADLLRWVVSGAIILFAHGAIAASVLLRAPSEEESASGAAIVVELAELPVAPTEQPPPEQVEPEPPIEQPEEKVEEPPTDVAMLPEPKQEVPKVAQEDTPPPAPTVAPTEGRQDASGSNLLPQWQKQIIIILERTKRYPSEARNKRQQGVARIAFNMDRQGKVTSTRLVASSGSPLLDQEAMELARRAQPFPPPPSVLPGSEVTVTVPVRFSLK